MAVPPVFKIVIFLARMMGLGTVCSLLRTGQDFSPEAEPGCFLPIPDRGAVRSSSRRSLEEGKSNHHAPLARDLAGIEHGADENCGAQVLSDVTISRRNSFWRQDLIMTVVMLATTGVWIWLRSVRGFGNALAPLQLHG